MTFARILDNGDLLHPYRVPNVLRLSDGDHDLRSGAVELLASFGIFEVVETTRPADTDTTTHDRTVELVAGVPTVVWTQRAKTDDELVADRQAAAPDPVTVLTGRSVAASNAAPQRWSADERYLPGAIVLDGPGGDRYRNDLGVVNVWPLTERHARWTNLDFVEPVGPQPWEPWTGFNEDLYQIGDQVTHNGQTWEATAGNNHWEPGAPGTSALWVVV